MQPAVDQLVILVARVAGCPVSIGHSTAVGAGRVVAERNTTLVKTAGASASGLATHISTSRPISVQDTAAVRLQRLQALASEVRHCVQVSPIRQRGGAVDEVGQKADGAALVAVVRRAGVTAASRAAQCVPTGARAGRAASTVREPCGTVHKRLHRVCGNSGQVVALGHHRRDAGAAAGGGGCVRCGV